MPLRLNEIIDKDPKLMDALISHITNKPDALLACGNKDGLLMSYLFKDNNKKLRLSYYLEKDENGDLYLRDCDATLPSNDIKLTFRKKINGDCYEVSYEDKHFEVETVNKEIYEAININQDYDCSLSLFPFNVVIYDSLEELNERQGFKEHGLSSDFICSGSLFNGGKEAYSLLIGKVRTKDSACFKIGEEELKVTYLTVKTGLGTLPLVLNSSYDEKVEIGQIMLIAADIKADFAVKECNFY